MATGEPPRCWCCGDYHFGNQYCVPPITPIQPTQPIVAGCICPPTSEKTCENPMCPRKNPFEVKSEQ